MTFKSLRNSPLDVYILLDLSSSQADILELLQNDLILIGVYITFKDSTHMGVASLSFLFFFSESR